VLLVLLVYFYGQPAMRPWRPAALDRSITEFRLTVDQATSDSYAARNAIADLWSMRKVQTALQNLNAAL
jgi:hypothetical protein